MRPSPGQTVMAVATTVVLASIIAGLILVGSPARGRLERLDADRIGDLEGIMRAMDRFWSRNERLPASLEELEDDPRIQVDPIDPVSGEPYEYLVVDEDSYELCAVFARESPALPGRTSADYWSHGVGRQCFELEADASGRALAE